MFVVKNKGIFFTISALLVVASIISIAVFGLKSGIDFAGGSILEVTYDDSRPSVAEVENALSSVTDSSVRETGDRGVLVRTPFIEEGSRGSVLNALTIGGTKTFTEDRFSSVGPSIGEELRRKSYIAITLVVLMIIFYVAFAFRHVSKPVSSWKYGLVAIVALVHDIIIPAGVFAALGLEVDVLFVMALLAILGFSVNDTIVVFDRIRETLSENRDRKRSEPFAETVGKSLAQTYTRSINTSFTTLLVLVALFIFAGTSIHNFVLTLIVGVLAGTYSSIFLASPLLVVLGKGNKKK